MRVGRDTDLVAQPAPALQADGSSGQARRGGGEDPSGAQEPEHHGNLRGTGPEEGHRGGQGKRVRCGYPF